MKVLLVHRYFWPDTPPYGHMLRDIATRLAGDGHDVRVLSTQPSYQDEVEIPPRPARENLGGVHVHRIRMPPERKAQRIRRALNMAYFAIRVLAEILVVRPDRVMISTSPPILGGLSVVLGAALARAKVIYHCMDVHPEVSLVLRGEAADRPALHHRTLIAVDRFVCKRAELVVVLSKDMKGSLLRRGGLDPKRVVVLNNFEVNDADPGPPATAATAGDRAGGAPLRVVFAGNLGRFQGLDTVADAVRHLDDEDPVEVQFVGDGALAASLRTELAGRAVDFTGYLPFAHARAVVAGCDVGLVTLAPGVIRYAYPSKTMTYLSEGVPIVAVVEKGSELAETLRSSGAGWSVEPGDSDGLASLLLRLAQDRELVVSARGHTTAVWEERFSSRRALDAWSDLYSSMP